MDTNNITYKPHAGQHIASVIAAKAFIATRPHFNEAANLHELFDSLKFEQAKEPIRDYMEMEHPRESRFYFKTDRHKGDESEAATIKFTHLL